jgi:Multiubiquitin
MENGANGGKQQGDGQKQEGGHDDKFEIQIDRAHFTVPSEHLTGLQLRHLPNPPIGPERDLFEVVPGGSDRKIGDEQVVEIRNGLRFFTAPAQINPGGIMGEIYRVACL